MRWIKKWITPFLMGTMSSITMQSLGIAECAPAVGAKMWCLILLFFLFVTLRVRITVRSRVHSSNKHCVAVYCTISTRFAAFISEGIALLEALHSSHFRRQVAPQFSRNCGQKLRKSKKSAEKFVRTTSCRQIAEGFEKNSTTVVQRRDCRCAPI